MLRLDLHIDINASYGRVLLTSATDSSLRQPAPSLVAGDAMPVRLYFWNRSSTGTLSAADPGETSVILFSARPAGVPSGSDLLFLCNDFTETATGVWDGSLDLNTAELAAHLASNPAGAKTITAEVEIQNADDTQRLSCQFDLAARPQVFANQETPLALPTPAAWLDAARPPLLLRTPVDGYEGIQQIAAKDVYTTPGHVGLVDLLVTVTGALIGSMEIQVPIEHTAITTATDIATAIRAVLIGDTVADDYLFTRVGDELFMMPKVIAANDATMNFVWEDAGGIINYTGAWATAGVAPIAGDGTVPGQAALDAANYYILSTVTPVPVWVTIALGSVAPGA